MLKKSFVWLAAAVLIMSMLSGCAGQTKEHASGTGQEQPSAQGEDGKPNTNQTVTLKYVSWMSKGEDKPTLEAFMKKYPHIKVEDEVIDGGTYDQILKTRILSEDAPDVFLVMMPQYPVFAKEGWLKDVSSLDGTGLLKQSKELSDLFTVDGQIYGSMISGGAGIQPVYYNKKYFEKLGVQPPATMDEFNKLLDTIKADGKDPLAVGGKDPWTIKIAFEQLYYSLNLEKYPKIKDALQNEQVKPSDIWASTLSYLHELVQKGYIGKSALTMSYDQSVQYFADGKAGLLIQGTWIPDLDAIKGAKDFELASFVMPLPKASDGKVHATATSDRTIVISASTKHPEEATLLYNFFLEKETLKQYNESQNLTTLLPGVEVKLNPALDGFMTIYSDPGYVYHYNVGAGLVQAYDDGINKTMQNILARSPVENELKELDQLFKDTRK